jgi:4-amino-4-deoxy-L-arabinose transferase-like glycosyltransferase
MVMTEIPFTFLLVLAYFIIVHQPAVLRSAVILGVVAGAGILMRGEALLLPVAYGGYWLLQRRSVRRAVILTIVSGLVAAACVGPWTYRNYRVMDAFVPINTSASDALWTGHYAGATGGITFDHLKLTPEEEAGLGPKKAEVESSARRQSAVLRFMRDHPVDEFELIPRKLLYLFSGDANTMTWVQAPTSGGAVLSAIQVQLFGVAADFYYYTLLSASLVGAVLAWRRRQRPAAALAFIAGIAAMFLFMHGWLTYGDARYRLPMMPFLIALAAVGIGDVWQAVSRAGDAPRLT